MNVIKLLRSIPVSHTLLPAPWLYPAGEDSSSASKDGMTYDSVDRLFCGCEACSTDVVSAQLMEKASELN